MNLETPPVPSPAAAPKAPAPLPPAPPPLLRRIGLLCLLPEQWPQAARYRLSATVWPVILVSFVMSFLVSLVTARDVVQDYSAFAASYDARFYPMEFKAGKLSRLTPATEPATQAASQPAASQPATAAATPAATAPATQPALTAATVTIREFPDGPGSYKPLKIVFDPENRLHVDAPEGAIAMRISDTETIVTEPETIFGSAGRESRWAWQKMATMLGVQLPDRLIDGPHLKSDELMAAVGLSIFMQTFFYELLASLAWALMVAFFALPIVTMAAPRLNMPRFVAYRIALAVTVPLIVLSGLLHMVGAGVYQVVPPELLPFFWFACTAALAGWSGVMANRMYAVRRQSSGRGT